MMGCWLVRAGLPIGVNNRAKSRLENRKFVDFFKRPRSPLTPLGKGGIRVQSPPF
ncbi:hypothetical protein PL8927_50131 [Planktothrix serta PCC 8927]|uniref:Uncharacterized protein n=1 Tax=Planktothrix serta PCC 8927 TaxID=671068 RepID=A0A7Z9BKC9_9CYAN|nr:hypothetical protein PL8927_50131 [Planktothrix serta PCC 8927]